MAAMVETLKGLGAAWLLWAESFLHDAAQLPYRVALVAFTAGAVLAWFAAKDWFMGGEEDGEAQEPGNG